nr:Uncharacterised protein [Klebsiella pneumoniae]
MLKHMSECAELSGQISLYAEAAHLIYNLSVCSTARFNSKDLLPEKQFSRPEILSETFQGIYMVAMGQTIPT